MLRPALRAPLTRPLRRPTARAGRSLAAQIKSLFSNGEQGAWYEPSLTNGTLFQDSAGTTPVTGVGQPVGKMLDRSGWGNHATQPTSVNRPVLSARVNLLTRTEQFDDATWIKSIATVTADTLTSPTGSLTAETVDFTSISGIIYQTINQTSSCTASFYARQGTANSVRLQFSNSGQGRYADFNLAAGTAGTVTVLGSGGTVSGGTASIQSAGDGWYRCTITEVNPGGASYFMVGAASIIGSVHIWGADLRPTNSGVNLPAYQRVNTATDYDTAGFPLYLAFNGTNSWMSTGSIDFSGTDKMTVCAGVRKLSDAVGQLITELGAVSAGGFYLYAGNFVSASGPLYTSLSRGAASQVSAQAAQSPSSYASPVTNVLASKHDISGDLTTLRINAASVATGTSDKGAGSFGNLPLYLGARSGTSLFFNGQIYSLVIRAALSSDSQITALEKFANSKTGAWA